MSNTETESKPMTPAPSVAGEGFGASPVRKFHHWRVRKELPDESYQFVDYQSNCGPVTAEHVLTAPSVRRWIGSDKLACIYPPSAPEHAIYFPNEKVTESRP